MKFMRNNQASTTGPGFRPRGRRTWLSLGSATSTIVIGLFLYPRDSYAYVDPGSGSMFLQLLLASLLGALYTIKMYWRKIRSWLTGSKEPESPSEQKPPAESQDS